MRKLGDASRGTILTADVTATPVAGGRGTWDGVMVHLNRQLVFEAKGFVSIYTQVPLDDKARAALRPDAENVLAISCKQTTGGQYIDVGLSVKNRNR